MDRLAFWIATAAAGLALVGPALAADSPATAPTPSRPATPIASRPARTRHFIGEVVAVDQAAKTITVKRAGSTDPKDMTFTVASEATLTGLTPGDHVKIGYVKANGHLTATTVAKNAHTAKK